MKNKSFIIVAVVLVVAAFVAATQFMKPKEETNAPAAWVLETLVRPDSYAKGPADAKVTVVEFFDPECEACRAIHPTVKRLQSEYDGRIRYVYRYMPFHANSLFAASVLEEARAQGKYEEALDVLFEKQHTWGSHDNPQPQLIIDYVSALGIDRASLEKEKVIAKYKDKVENDQKDGQSVLVDGTPSFFVNGRRVLGLSYEQLKAAIDAALGD